MIRALLIVVFMAFGNLHADAQRRPRRDKGSDVQTPENALDRDKEERARIEAEYKAKHDHQNELQDKSTRKRMKRNLKRSQRQSWGKEIPWYKRVFRRRRF